MTSPIDPKDAVKAAGWLSRNVPTLVSWFRWFRKGGKAGAVLLALAVSGCTTAQVAGIVAGVGIGAKIIGALPDLPKPPSDPVLCGGLPMPKDDVGSGLCAEYPPGAPGCFACEADRWVWRSKYPRPRPTVLPTAAPTAEPTPTPSATPTERPTAAPTATPTVPPTPTRCSAATAPPSHYVRPRAAPCRRGYVEEVGLCWAEPDTSSPCRPCAEHAYLDIRGGHARIDDEGRYVEDANGEPRLWDAYCRKWREDGSLIGDWGYSGNCAPRTCAVEMPTPVPTAGPIPTPGAPSPCPCIVVDTVAFLGWNDRAGIPPTVVAGGEAVIDLTRRGARSPGDRRGAACDKAPWGCTCEAEGDPVDWHIEGPAGGVHRINDGYGVRLSDLGVGSYRITTSPRPVLNQRGEPVVMCPWPHGGEGAGVRDTLTFEVR